MDKKEHKAGGVHKHHEAQHKTHHATSEKEHSCETFEVEKKGKIEYKTLCSAIEQSHSTREEVKRHKKILMWVLLGIGILFVVLATWMIVAYYKANFEYRGVKYSMVEENDIIFYRTQFPTMFKGVLTDYNFYIRNNPKELEEKVAFNGDFVLKQDMILDSEKDFNCEGKGIIGVANLVKFYSFVGTKVIKDQNVACDADGKYMFVVLRESDKTSIEQFGPACYYLNIHNCEVLEATERFMTEGFADINGKI